MNINLNKQNYDKKFEKNYLITVETTWSVSFNLSCAFSEVSRVFEKKHFKSNRQNL